MSLFLKPFAGRKSQIREIWYCDAQEPARWDVRIIGMMNDNRIVDPGIPGALAFYVFCVWDRADLDESTKLVTDGELWGILDPDARDALLDLEGPDAARYKIRDYSVADQALLVQYIQRYTRAILGTP